ncbi:hypothetical protein [Leptospira jelokensis]|uniref:hypothetical protein n=1 Tax=Leptospira jelokensis TaxID=2484931 RepID=UPI001FC9F380|nr:hypothetical protein [Leptospira jelokensis]
MYEWILFSSTLLVTIFFLKVVTFPKKVIQLNFKLFFFIGFGLRVLCFFFPPVWEDDWARYLWEGNLIRNWISPYEVAPNFYFSEFLEPLPSEILSKINHPDWTTIYSPFILLYFSLFTYGFSTFFLKVSYLFFESICFAIVPKHKMNFMMLLYWVYPIFIKEVYINLHFEVLLVSFFWIFYTFLKKENLKLGAGIFGFLVHMKFLTSIYGLLFIPYLRLKNSKQTPAFWIQVVLSLSIGFLLFFGFYLILFPNSNDFGLSNLHHFGETFTFNQFFEPVWKFFFTINLRSIPFFFQFLLLFIYLYLTLKEKNKTKRFFVLCQKHDFYFYFGYFIFTNIPVVNPWYFLTLVPLIIISRSQSILPWILISSLQLSYLTNIRLGFHFQFLYEIPTPILVLEAILSISCIFLYFRRIFILLYKISNISNIALKG